MQLTFKKQPDLRQEIPRRKSQTAQILELLKHEPHGNLTNIDLQKIAFNYTMRVSELRKEGHEIEAEYVKPGVFRYFYQGQVD
jgi:hypothetical protein